MLLYFCFCLTVITKNVQISDAMKSRSKFFSSNQTFTALKRFLISFEYLSRFLHVNECLQQPNKKPFFNMYKKRTCTAETATAETVVVVVLLS